jgi:hypothetical protein
MKNKFLGVVKKVPQEQCTIWSNYWYAVTSKIYWNSKTGLRKPIKITSCLHLWKPTPLRIYWLRKKKSHATLAGFHIPLFWEIPEPIFNLMCKIWNHLLFTQKKEKKTIQHWYLFDRSHHEFSLLTYIHKQFIQPTYL